jgi:[acyl-carrier-protein] S-malonyltransferase
MAVVNKGKAIDNGKICSMCKDLGVFITLNNTPRQMVVGGSKKRLAEMGDQLKKEGLLSTMLKVEGPFHTPIMKPAADKFKQHLERCEIEIASKPVLANVTTEAIVDPLHIRQELYNQIFNIVNWRGTIERLIRRPDNLFIELGPKQVLSNMIKDIDPSASRINMEDIDSLERTVGRLAQQIEA